MDKPTTPTGPTASKPPLPEDSGSEQDFGATGVFGAVKAPERVEGLAVGSKAEPEAHGNRATETAKPQPVPGPKAFAEPVVHRVVFGGGAAESSPELLDRMRMASAERLSMAEKAPVLEPGSKGAATGAEPLAAGRGSGGFTELLRALGSESPASPVAAKETLKPETPRPAQDSGFASLLRTLSSPETAATPVESPVNTVQPAVRSIPEEPSRAPAASGSGGFTELLRATPRGGLEFAGPQTLPPGLGEASVAGGSAGVTPVSLENKPGTFTQLFGTLEDAGASPPPATPISRETGGSSYGSAGSFTRMLSLEQQSSAAEPAFYEERKPLAGSLDYGLTPQTVGPAKASRDPFSQPLPETQPVQSQSTPPAAGVGITRLIQMLDEPSRAPAPRMEDAPVSPPPGTEPGVWTQTFASLSTPSEPVAPTAKMQDWPPPQAPLGGTGSPASREASFSASLNEPAVSTPQAASGTSGPSEFTRILDASRLRELSMRGSLAAGNPVPPPLPTSASPPTPIPLPNYPVPGAPPAGGMHGLGGMPQPGGFSPPQPPQLSGYPMNYGPHAGAIPAPGGNLPQPPGMYAPAPPLPTAPPVPPVKSAGSGTGMGKLQQYVPLLLVLIIVLLVVLLVTVVFLLKH